MEITRNETVQGIESALFQVVKEALPELPEDEKLELMIKFNQVSLMNQLNDY